MQKWEHYSSIRNTSGPHTGPPNITFGSSSAEAKTGARTKAKDSLAKRSYAQAWMVDQIQVALPYSATREAIIEALEAYKGNMTYAVSALMPASSQSSSRSSSIEREMDSDDEIDLKPKKKADRRPSRPQPLRIGKSNKDFKTDTEDSHSSSPDPSQLSAALSKLAGDDEVDPDETEEENWHNDSPSKGSGTTTESTSASESSAASNDAAGPVVRIKLSQPRKPIEKMQPVSSSSSDQSYGGDDDDDVSKSQPSRVIAKPKSRLVSSAKRDETNTIKSVDKPQNASPGSSEKSYNGEYDADGEKKKSPKVIARPRRRLITGAERDRLNAIKARKAARRSSLSPTSANSKTSSHSPPVIDVGIKVLRI